MAPANDPTFHSEHGDNVELTVENQVATRLRGFDRGLCAMNTPFPLASTQRTGHSAAAAATGNQPSNHVSLLITRTQSKWSGSLGLGVSTLQPSRASLPASARSAEKGWTFAQVPQNVLAEGTLLTVWVDFESRTLCYAATRARDREVLEAGGEEVTAKGEVLLDDPTILDCLEAKKPLWFYVDIYGFVTQVKILGTQIHTLLFSYYLTFTNTYILINCTLMSTVFKFRVYSFCLMKREYLGDVKI